MRWLSRFLKHVFPRSRSNARAYSRILSPSTSGSSLPYPIPPCISLYPVPARPTWPFMAVSISTWDQKFWCWDPGSHRWILAVTKTSFFTCSEPKGQLTWNLVRIIEMTCRSKIAKIVPIGNTIWLPQLPSWKAILNFFSWIEGQLCRNMIGSVRVTCRSKIAKIILS